MITEITKKYKDASSILILLDYDGTLVNFAHLPNLATPGHQLLKTLYLLTREPFIRVIIITGRDYRTIDNWVGHLPIEIIAEHGAMIKENNQWRENSSDYCLWKKEIFLLLHDITSKCAGSFIEEKTFSLTWHYRNAEPEAGNAYSKELIGDLKKYIHTYNLKILDGNKVVEIMNKEIGKGKAVKNLLEQNNFDYILAIGDDKTDEDMFEFLLHNTNADTVKVGNGNTHAKYKLDNVNEVISLLEQLSQCG